MTKKNTNRLNHERWPEHYTPSMEEAQKYFRVWNSLPNYTDHERALAGLFRDPGSAYRDNTDIAKVIIKASCLNDFYSTNIYRVHQVAKKIVGIKDFDKRLDEGDISLVDEIAENTYTTPEGEEKKIVYYSFATKYCSHHRPELFPIYDSYVDAVLRALRRQYRDIFVFKNDDLRDYSKYKHQLDVLREHFGLTGLSYKELDRYLWQLGKRYFAEYIDAVNGKIDYDKF